MLLPSTLDQLDVITHTLPHDNTSKNVKVKMSIKQCVHFAEQQLHLFLKLLWPLNKHQCHKLDGGQFSVRKRGEGSRKTERDSERQTDTSQLTEILYEHKISPLVTKLTQSKVNYGSDVNKFVQYSVFWCFPPSETTKPRVDSLFHFLFAGPHLSQS